LGVEADCPWVDQFDLNQCTQAKLVSMYSVMLKEGVHASLMQSPLVDLQSLESLESNLLEPC
jgi:hypothetical protein